MSSPAPPLALPDGAPHDARASEMIAGWMTTMLVHGAIALFVLWQGIAEEPAGEPQRLPVITTELLQWGERMPTAGELPEIANPAPAPEDTFDPTAPPPTEVGSARQETVVLNPEPAEISPPEPRRTELREQEERSPSDARFRGQTNPNRPTNTSPVIGSSDGFIGGTSLSETAQRNIFARLVAQLQRAFRPPASIPEEELSQYVATLRVRVTSEGRITTWDFVQGSGNRLFDAAVERMLNRFRQGSDRLDMGSITDPAFRAAIESQGFVIQFRDQ